MSDIALRVKEERDDGVILAECCYLWLLQQKWPNRPQNILCELRNFIARTSDRSEEDVQNEFEARAEEARPRIQL